MRVIAVGTPAFALPTFDALHQADDVDLVAVITNPDRPRGRGLEPGPTPAKEWALARGVTVYTTDKLTADPTQGRIELADSLPIFALVVVASGLFIPKWLREGNAEYSLHGAINLHPSLLPKWRGPAPIAWTIIEGDEVAGVTTMSLVRDLDEGPIYLQKEIAMGPRETAGKLAETLAKEGAKLVLETLRVLEAEAIKPKPQNEAQATFTSKITSETRQLDWTLPATKLDCRVRGLYPDAPARASLGGELVQILAAEPAEGPADAAPGTITALDEAGVVLACGEGALKLTRVKPAGRGEMTAHAFAIGRRLAAGDRFD
ncbi:MAG: methionyl-tRNA formyltransferase [bacterium]